MSTTSFATHTWRTNLATSAVIPPKLDFIYHSVMAINKAAIDFTQKKLLKKNGSFTFNKLVPAPRIISKSASSASFIVTTKELQAFQEQNANRVNTEFEAEGLLFIEDEDGSIKESHCTQECSDKLMEQYGANDWYDWSYANWGVKWDASTVNEYNDGNVDFDTPWNTPFLFWEALTDACPEGHWKLYVKAECGYEGLHISIKDGLASSPSTGYKSLTLRMREKMAMS